MGLGHSLERTGIQPGELEARLNSCKTRITVITALCDKPTDLHQQHPGERLRFIRLLTSTAFHSNDSEPIRRKSRRRYAQLRRQADWDRAHTSLRCVGPSCAPE